MIINCNNCNKNFNIADNLIPESGRLLKCGNCENTWFFHPNKEIFINPSNNKEFNLTKDTPIQKDLQEEIIEKKANKFKKGKKEKVKKDILKNTLSNFLIIIITILAIILIIDTLKWHISNIFPNIIPLLDNLYESLYDLQLFIKDLLK